MDKIDKACSKCKIVKLMDDFHKKKNLSKHPDGRYSQCKSCVSAYMKSKYDADPEKQKNKSKKWSKENPEKQKEAKRKWESKNRERHLEIKRESYEKNKVAVRNRRLIKSYGISAKEFDFLSEQQQNCCAICKTKEISGPKNVKFLSVDHDHATGKVRGLLCSYCNAGLGHFKDSPEAIESAMRYLGLEVRQ